jgi:thiazole synthase ThiGH ThiG subunit
MDTNECVATTVVAQLTRDFLSVNWIKMERAKQPRLNPA